MPVTLTIKQVPDHIAKSLRSLAAKHHRSLQGELMSIIETATEADGIQSVGLRMTSRILGEELTPYEASGQHIQHPAMANAIETDNLLDQLDAIVAGSKWGTAPLLTRGQANDRALIRELHYLADEGEGR